MDSTGNFLSKLYTFTDITRTHKQLWHITFWRKAARVYSAALNSTYSIHHTCTQLYNAHGFVAVIVAYLIQEAITCEKNVLRLLINHCKFHHSYIIWDSWRRRPARAVHAIKITYASTRNAPIRAYTVTRIQDTQQTRVYISI